MRRATGAAFAILAAFAATDAVSQAPLPSAAPRPTADDFTVVSRFDNTQTVDSADLKLVLTKAKREEHAVVRRLLFIAATLRLTEPLPPPDAASIAAPEPAASSQPPEAEAGPAPKQTCRWTYRAFMQRQICFTSMTGLSSCTQPEIIALPDTAEGDAPISDAPQQGTCNDIFRPAVNARIRLSSALLSRSKDLFAEDQQAKIDPQFKAAGVKATVEAITTTGSTIIR